MFSDVRNTFAVLDVDLTSDPLRPAAGETPSNVRVCSPEASRRVNPSDLCSSSYVNVGATHEILFISCVSFTYKSRDLPRGLTGSTVVYFNLIKANTHMSLKVVPDKVFMG